MLKKIRNYFLYRRIVMKHEEQLASPQLALRVDLLGRMYTVVNMPPDLLNYSDDMVRTVVKNYVYATSEYFYSIGLFELVSTYACVKQDEANYLVVFGYAHMDPRVIGYAVKYALLALLGAAAAFGLYKFLSHV